MANMIATFTFASPWALSTSGRDELLRSFRERDSGAGAQFLPEGPDPEAISLRCTEQCFIDFAEFAGNFLDQELSQMIEEDFDVFEEPKLMRVDDTFEEPPPEISLIAVEELSSSSNANPTLEHPLDPLIIHEACHATWKPPGYHDNQGNRENHDSRFWLLLPHIIGRLERLAQVRVELPSNSTALKIHADSEAAIAHASQKLDTLEKAMSHHNLIHNYVVSEAELSPQFCLLPLKEVPGSRMRTTLMAPQSPQYKSIRNSNILVIVKDGEYGKIEPSFRSELSKHLWDGHPLTLQTSRQATRKLHTITPISKWVDESNSAQVIDPFTPQTKSEAASQNPPRSEEPKLPTQDHVSTKRVRKVKGAVEPNELIDASLQDKQDDRQTRELPAIECAPQSSAFRDDPDFAPVDEALLAREESSRPQAPAQSQATASLNFRPPMIKPPYMPSPSVVVGKTWEPDRHAWDNRVVSSGARIGNLIDLSSPPVESKAANSPQKKVHRTMGQKKARMITSQTQLRKVFDEEVKEMLRSVIACCDVKIFVSIGRILVDRHTIPLENRKKPFGFEEWPNVVGHIRTDFTERITTKSYDISNIVGLKQARGRSIFDELPCQRKVTYNITCSTRNSEIITIVIVEDGDYKVQGEDVANGAINWHFPKRAWDACLQVTSHEFTSGPLLDEAKIFVKTLQLSDERDEAGLKVQFSNEGSGFQVQSMTLRREIVYTAATFPDVRLHATEVQIFHVTQPKPDEHWFTATLAPQDEMIIDHRLWWEVSISSQHMDDSLEESVDLELGEKAGWKAEEVLKFGVEDMYELAQDTVTRIDFVGIGNKGPATSKSKGTKPSERSYELPTGIPGYW